MQIEEIQITVQKVYLYYNFVFPKEGDIQFQFLQQTDDSLNRRQKCKQYKKTVHKFNVSFHKIRFFPWRQQRFPRGAGLFTTLVQWKFPK